MYKGILATVVSAVLVAGLAHAAEIPEVKEIGSPVFLDSFNGSRPDIACDALGQPHAVVEDLNKHNPEWHFYDQVGSQWQVTPFNLLSHYSSGDEFGNPHVEISDEGVAWYSGRMSSLRTPLGWGMGMVVRTDMTSNPGANLYFFRDLHGIRTPLGDASLDPFVANRASTMIQTGPFKTYQFNPAGGTFSDVGGGRLNLGNGGEKVAFRISHANDTSANTWHGCTEQFYVNSKLGASLTWANWNSYPSMWDDGCYPGLGTDNKNSDVAYMAADYKMSGYPPYGIYINIYNPEVGSGMAFGHDPLLVDPNGTSGLRRYPPRWAPAKDGGAWLCWTRYNNIMLRYIPADLKRDYAGQPYAESLAKCGPEITVGPGTRGAIATDPDGNIHLIYVNNGMQYRKVMVNDVAQKAPFPAQDFDGDGAADVATFSSGAWFIRYSENIKSMDEAVSTPDYVKIFGAAGDLPVPSDYDGDKNNGSEIAVFRPANATWYILHADGRVQITPYGSTGDTPVPGAYRSGGTNTPAICGVNDNKELVWYSSDGALDGVVWGQAGDLLVPRDYDGDGITDVAVVRSENGNWRWLIRNSTAADVNVLYGLSSMDIPVPSDYDSDGTVDLCVFRPGSGTWYYHGSTSGGQSVGWGATDDLPAPGDYDGDGTNDIAVFRSSNEGWYIRSSDQGNSLIESAPVYLGSAPDRPLSGNFDGDNRDDMVTFDSLTGKWKLYLSGASGVDRIEPTTFLFGSKGDQAVPADYDGDGVTDVGIFRESTGSWFAYGSTDGLLQTTFGAPGDKPYPADYDGDGKADWCVVRPFAGMLDWYRWSSKHNSFMGRTTVGWATDQPVPDDYDGDGTNDIAIYRSTGAQAGWHFLQSTDGYEYVPFGAPGDIPMHGQWDADDIADFGVYRPSTGTWYLWSSVSGLISDTWGGTGDKPVPADYDGDGNVDISVYRAAQRSVWYINQSSDPGQLLIRGPIRWKFTGADIPIGAHYGL